MNADQKEELRRIILTWMCERRACAYNCVSVQGGVSRLMRCTVEEVEDEMTFLHKAGMLDEVPNKLGSRKYFEPSAKGLLAYEGGL